MRILLTAIHPEPPAVAFARLMDQALRKAGVIKPEGR